MALALLAATPAKRAIRPLLFGSGLAGKQGLVATRVGLPPHDSPICCSESNRKTLGSGLSPERELKFGAVVKAVVFSLDGKTRRPARLALFMLLTAGASGIAAAGCGHRAARPDLHAQRHLPENRASATIARPVSEARPSRQRGPASAPETKPESVAAPAPASLENPNATPVEDPCRETQVAEPIVGTTHPPDGWWKEFAHEPVSRAPERRRHIRGAPKVAVQFYGLEDHSRQPARTHRQYLGLHRMCYEAVLAGDPHAAGYWVASVSTTAEDHLCGIKTIATDLPAAMIECIERHVRRTSNYGRMAGTLEFVVRYHPPRPWGGDENHGRL